MTPSADVIPLHAPPPLWANQLETVAKASNSPGFCDWSDPGTGKTRAHLQDFAQAGGRLLVVASKSILQPAWGNDIDHFFPGMTYTVANADNREKAFKTSSDVVITNHDAVVWLVKQPKLLASFNRFIADESTAFKNPNSQRSKAMKDLAARFKWRRVMSGTPNPHSIVELWHQVLLVDGGERLGTSYWRYRSVACEPTLIKVGKEKGKQKDVIEWRDRPGIEQAVFDLLSDISIRHRFDECVSIPPNTVFTVEYDLPRTARAQYDEMRQHGMLLLNSGEAVTAVNAATVRNKLLQIASGALYTGNGDDYAVLDEGRTELVLDLVEQRRHSLVAFQWKHQRDQLIAGATRRGFAFGVIDGAVTGNDRNKVVREFQEGKLKVLFAHPQSAGHGLTLVRGTATIWASPTWNAEHYKQFNARIARAGQTERTETILVQARRTVDERVYAGLGQKLTSMQMFLDLMEAA